MDRRTIFAIVLIVLIFILTPYYYKWIGIEPKPNKKQLRDSTLVVDTTQSKNDSLVESKAIVAATQKEIVKSKQKTEIKSEKVIPLNKNFKSNPDTTSIIVENDFFKVELNNLHSGNFKAFYLKKYEYYKGGWVNLIDQNGLNIEFLNKEGVKTSLFDINAFVKNSPGDSIFLQKDEQITITFIVQSQNGNPIFERQFTFNGGDYRIKVKNIFYHPQSFVNGMYYQVGWKNGIPLVEENIFDDNRYQDAVIYMGDELEFVSAKKEEKTYNYNGKVDWVANRNKYFSIFIKPLNKERTENAIVRAFSIPDTIHQKLRHKKYDDYITYKINNTNVEVDSLVLYLGPLDYGILKQYGWNFDKLVLNKGWYEKYLRPITLLLLAIFKFLHQFIPNYGFVIIVFSILLKLLLFPLTKKSYQSMKEMQLLQPVINEIREKYKDNPQKMNQELMGLYKKYGVNPMGGCLPMILQMPVLFALFVVFKSTIQLRGQEFIFWITDLSAPDKLFLGMNLPFVGSTIHILPILSAISMIFQSKQQSSGSQNKALAYFMPLFFMVLLYNFPSGLHLYYFVFNVLSYFQQKYIKEPVPLEKRVPKEKVQKKKRK